MTVATAVGGVSTGGGTEEVGGTEDVIEVEEDITPGLEVVVNAGREGVTRIAGVQLRLHR